VGDTFITAHRLVDGALTDEWQTSTELRRKLGLDHGAVASVLTKLFRAGAVERRGAGVTGEPFAYRRGNSPGGGAFAAPRSGLGMKRS
jgi:hypothetical protein